MVQSSLVVVLAAIALSSTSLALPVGHDHEARGFWQTAEHDALKVGRTAARLAPLALVREEPGFEAREAREPYEIFASPRDFFDEPEFEVREPYEFFAYPRDVFEPEFDARELYERSILGNIAKGASAAAGAAVSSAKSAVNTVKSVGSASAKIIGKGRRL